MKLLCLMAAGLIAFTLAVGASPSFAQETIPVRGRVVNGTEGANVPPGLDVQLHAFSRTAGSFTTAESTTEGDGTFRFDEVPLLEEGAYAVTADYGGMRYSMLLDRQELSRPLELMVYEPTQDIAVIQIEHQALIISEISEGDQEIKAAEFLTLSNTSDRTLVPDLSNVGQGQFSFLRFSLPPQAQGLEVESDLVGGEIISIGSGFALTAPVTPGDHSVSFTFSFPYRGDAAVYRQRLLQGAEIYQVLVPDRLSQVQVGSLEPKPSLEVSGVTYRVWEGQGFAPGQGFEVRLTGLPQPGLLLRIGKSVTRGAFWRMAIPVTLGVTLAGLLLYGGVKAPRGGEARLGFAVPAVTVDGDFDGYSDNNSHGNSEGNSEGDSGGNSEGRLGGRSELVRAIAALDESFHQGEVEPAAYRTQRDQLKARVLESSEPVESGQAREPQ